MTIRTKTRAPSHRPLGQAHDAVGLAGEEAFAARYGYKVDREYAQRGDGGADFSTRLGSVDVKTYRKPAHLPVEEGKVRADYYVLARYTEPVGDAAGVAALLGWTDRATVLAAPVTDVGGFGVQSHAVRVDALHGLPSLDAMFGAWCAGCGLRVIYPGKACPMTGRPRPADFTVICDACFAKDWQLVAPTAPARR